MAYSGIGKNWKEPCMHLRLDTSEFTDVHRKYDNHVFLVYLHINKINGNVYVGITHHVNPNKRWGYSGQKYTHCVKFAHAINKYGWDNFDHIVICRTNKERAIVIERVLIAHYKRLGVSYNITDGGEGAECIPEENRRKIKERMRTNHPMKGRHHTLEARARISEAGRKRVYTEEQKEQLRRAGELGRKTMKSPDWKFPDEARKKCSERFSKPVLQYDLKGNFIKEFSSATEADRSFSKGNGHHISDVCNGKRKTAYGFTWVYKERRQI